MARQTTARRPRAPRRLARCVQDWPTLFHHFIESRRVRPFAWGSNDCCLFACDGVLAQTGLDPAAGMFRGKYRDALGAARLVRKHGGVEAIAEKVCRRHGFHEVPVAMAQRGDVVLSDKAGEMSAGMKRILGMCCGRDAAFVGPAGLVFIPTGDCLRAWRVG